MHAWMSFHLHGAVHAHLLVRLAEVSIGAGLGKTTVYVEPLVCAAIGFPAAPGSLPFAPPGRSGWTEKLEPCAVSPKKVTLWPAEIVKHFGE